MFAGFEEKKPGSSHLEKNKLCQDASTYMSGPDYAVVVVSDGHGGDKYFRSGRGAKSAVNVARTCLLSFLKNFRGKLEAAGEQDRNILLRHLTGHIIATWRAKIEQDFLKNPLSGEEEALCKRLGLDTGFQASFYGATLLYAGMTPKCRFAAQIGDGQCLFLHEGTASSPIPEDDRLGFGMTTSLCDADAINSFRFAFARVGEEPPVQGIFLMTDGVADSYTPEGLRNFACKLLTAMQTDKTEAGRQLKEWLPTLSARGSRDDMSIAGIYQKSA